MRIASLWILAAIAVMVIAAGQQVSAQPQAVPAEALPDVAGANNRFGFALLSQLTDGQTDNVFVSPLSIALALDMTLNGAAGDTRSAMMQALEAQNLSLADLNQASQHLRAELTNVDPQVQLSVANSLWLQTGETLVPDFVKTADQFYGAKASLVDFASPTSNAAIDAWVKQSTGGMIPAIAGPDPFTDTLCVLADAVYFHGQWTTSFDPTKTVTGPFTLLDGSKIDLPMMSQSGQYEYLKRPGMQMIRLPYGTGRLAMYVILPGEMIGLADASKAVTAESWKDWSSSMVSMPGKIVLPQFRVDYGADLKPVLAAMGMGAAFDPKAANFSGMYTGQLPIYVNDVLHKALLDVNEQGTEAAAGTGIRTPPTSTAPAPQEPFEMIVNRPFFCAIVDRDTGAILFIGSIVNPEVIPAPVPAPAAAATSAQPATDSGGASQPAGHQRRVFRRQSTPPQHGTPRGGQAPPGAQPPPNIQSPTVIYAP
jgi:serpin B